MRCNLYYEPLMSLEAVSEDWCIRCCLQRLKPSLEVVQIRVTLPGKEQKQVGQWRSHTHTHTHTGENGGMRHKKRVAGSAQENEGSEGEEEKLREGSRGGEGAGKQAGTRSCCCYGGLKTG